MLGISPLSQNNLVNEDTIYSENVEVTTSLVIPTAAPSTPQDGSMYFDTATQLLYIYATSTWYSIQLT